MPSPSRLRAGDVYHLYPRFNRRQHPQSHADLALSANHAHALSLNARIDVLDAKCYDSPFVFGFILRSRRMQGGRDPHRPDSLARPTVGTQKLCVCCQMPIRVAVVTHFLHSSPWPFDCYAWRSPREFASYRSPHPSWPKSSEVEFQPSRCT